MEIITNPTEDIAAQFKLPNTAGIIVQRIVDKVVHDNGSFSCRITVDEDGYIRRWMKTNNVDHELVYKDEYGTVCSKRGAKSVDIYIKDLGDAVAFRWKWEDFATT